MTKTNHIPPGYKASPLGPIPADWDIMELGQVTKVRRGRFSPRPRNDPKYYGGKIPFVQTGDVTNSDGRVSKYSQSLNEEGLKVSILFPKGTILITIAANIGHSAILDIDMACPDSLVGLICNGNLYNEYLNFQLRYIQKRIEYIAPGAQKNINVEFLDPLPIVVPPLLEQTAIANLLSTWDKAIQTTTQLIAQKEQRKKWLMQQLLTGKKRLKGFNGEWKEYSYDKLLKEVSRPIDEWSDKELYKLISVRRRSGGIFFREALYGHQIKVKGLHYANEGDFLFSKMQILHGASALVTKEFAGAKISGSYIAVVASDTNVLNMEFFKWYSQLPYFYHQTYISSYGVHIEKMTFDFESFLSLEMKLPSIAEQAAIADLLQAADKEIQLLKAKAEQLKEQKKGLMQILLTGKKRLKISKG
jgi:type I restriction enzyme S subunit